MSCQQRRSGDSDVQAALLAMFTDNAISMSHNNGGRTSYSKTKDDRCIDGDPSAVYPDSPLRERALCQYAQVENRDSRVCRTALLEALPEKAL